MKSAIIPEQFTPSAPFAYPPNCREMFEEYFFKSHHSGRTCYLPVQWTSYYINADFGKEKEKIQRLQEFLDSINDWDYYTIVQYDDGILNSISHLNLRVYGVSGARITDRIPLLSTGIEHTSFCEGKYLANFIGMKSHPVREWVMRLKGKEGFMIRETNMMPTHHYGGVIAASTFTLCPRGYGEQSFRVQEAVQLGSIPVIITDSLTPYPEYIPFDTFGVVINRNDFNFIEQILRSYTKEEILYKQSLLADAYKKYYNYEALKEHILTSEDSRV